MKNDASEDESDEENEEGDYTVYECPGLAPVSKYITSLCSSNSFIDLTKTETQIVHCFKKDKKVGSITLHLVLFPCIT